MFGTESRKILDLLDIKNNNRVYWRRSTSCADIRQEISERALSEEKIKFELSRWILSWISILSRHSSKNLSRPMFIKLLISDTLKLNYLSDPALSLVKSLEETEEIGEGS